MRSIWSSGIASIAAAPEDADAIRSPSMSTSVWAALAPRRKMPDVPPGPPFWTISTPLWRCRSSARLCAPLRRISSESMTVTSARRSVTRCGMRDAVTATRSMGSATDCAPAGARPHGCGDDQDARAVSAADERRLHGRLHDGPRIPARRLRDEGVEDAARARAVVRSTCSRDRAAPPAPRFTRFLERSARTGRSPGLPVLVVRLPVLVGQWRPSRARRLWTTRTGLPLRGQPRHCASRFTAFPFNPRAWTAPRTPVRRFYRETTDEPRRQTGGAGRRTALTTTRTASAPGRAPGGDAQRRFGKNERGSHFVGPRRPFPPAVAILARRCSRPHRITTGVRGAPVTKKLYIRTFGCQMNEYDSARMADVLAASDDAIAHRASRRRRHHPVQHLLGAREGAGARVPRSRPRARAQGGATRTS